MVYFIECSGYIKIGYSYAPDLRFRNLCGSTPHEMRLLGASCGTLRFERKLHKQFEHLRHKGEWYRKGPDLLKLIRNLCAEDLRTWEDP